MLFTPLAARSFSGLLVKPQGASAARVPQLDLDE
jgi:hypothetical protein